MGRGVDEVVRRAYLCSRLCTSPAIHVTVEQFFLQLLRTFRCPRPITYCAQCIFLSNNMCRSYLLCPPCHPLPSFQLVWSRLKTLEPLDSTAKRKTQTHTFKHTPAKISWLSSPNEFEDHTYFRSFTAINANENEPRMLPTE